MRKAILSLFFEGGYEPIAIPTVKHNPLSLFVTGHSPTIMSCYKTDEYHSLFQNSLCHVHFGKNFPIPFVFLIKQVLIRRHPFRYCYFKEKNSREGASLTTSILITSFYLLFSCWLISMLLQKQRFDQVLSGHHHHQVSIDRLDIGYLLIIIILCPCDVGYCSFMM